MGITAVLWEPVCYYRSRLAEPPVWGLAVLPLVLQAVFSTWSASMTMVRAQDAIGGPLSDGVAVALAAFSVIVGVALTFWLSTGGMIAIDKLCNGHGETRRLKVRRWRIGHKYRGL